jgi:hypothetical protein
MIYLRLSFVVTMETIKPFEVVAHCLFVLTEDLSASGAAGRCMIMSVL